MFLLDPFGVLYDQRKGPNPHTQVTMYGVYITNACNNLFVGMHQYLVFSKITYGLDNFIFQGRHTTSPQWSSSSGHHMYIEYQYVCACVCLVGCVFI